MQLLALIETEVYFSIPLWSLGLFDKRIMATEDNVSKRQQMISDTKHWQKAKIKPR